jgi:hypothetical protein
VMAIRTLNSASINYVFTIRTLECCHMSPNETSKQECCLFVYFYDARHLEHLHIVHNALDHS